MDFSGENFNRDIAILSIAIFIISCLITYCYYKTLFNPINMAIYIIFNATMAFIFTLPLVVGYDIYITVIENKKKEGKIEGDYNFDDLKKKLKGIYKFIHWWIYTISDTIIPFLLTIYFKEINLCKLDKAKTILRTFLFIIICIAVFAVIIILLYIFLPEPTINKVKKNCEGWDGLFLNLRNLISLAEIEYNYIFLLMRFSILVMESGECMICCCKNHHHYNLRKRTKIWELGKLDEYNNKTNNENEKNELKKKLEKINKERRRDLMTNLINKIKTERGRCCCFYYVENLFLFPLFFIFSFFPILIILFNFFFQLELDSFLLLTKEENLYFTLLEFMILTYINYVILFYCIIGRKYFDTYFPYKNGEYNEIGFLNLLQYVLDNVMALYFLLYFVIIKELNIDSYFIWLEFTFSPEILFFVAFLLLILLFILTRKGYIENDYNELFDGLSQYNSCFRKGIILASKGGVK